MSKNVTLYRSDGAVLEEFLVATDYSLIKNKPTNFPPTAHSHDYLTAIDNRLVTPADINSYGTKQIRAYFTDYGGMTTGAKNSDYQDLLIMDTYSDVSGGKINALSFDKSEMKIYHFQAGFQANSWGNPKVLAYKEDIPIALKNPYPLTIQRNGTTVGSYDGSSAKTINIVDDDNKYVLNKKPHQTSSGNIVLIKTSIAASGNKMFWLEAEGQDYSGNAAGNFIRASGYFYNNNSFINAGGIYSSNSTLTMQFMSIDGNVAIAISGFNSYNSLRVRVYSGYTEESSWDKVTSITNVTSLPTNLYLTSVPLRKIVLDNDSRLTNSRPASDVYAWAKKSSLDVNDIPSLSISKITNLQSTLDSKVPTTRTINGKALSANISLTASDVGAVSTSGTAYNSTRWGNYQIRVGSYSNGDNGYITFSY